MTVGQYAKFLEARGVNGPPMWGTMDQPPHQKRPVVNVDWSDASTYCEWAGKRRGSADGRRPEGSLGSTLAIDFEF